MTTVTLKQPIQSRLIGWMFLAIIILSLTAFLLGDLLFHSIRTDPAKVFGAALPADVRALAAYEVPEGSIGEFYVESLATHLYLAQANSAAPLPAASLFDAVSIYAKKKESTGGFPAFLLKYAAAHVDTRYAGPLTASSLDINGMPMNLETFSVKKDDYFGIGILQRGSRAVLVVAQKKKQAIDPAALGELLLTIPAVRGE